MYFNFDDYIYEFFKQAEYYKSLMFKTSKKTERQYYKKLININIDKITELIDKSHRSLSKKCCENLREFTLEELSKYDGSKGKPAYVCIDGIIYDMSFMEGWGGGTHFGLYAGKDLTEEYYSCHRSQEILNKLPKIGVLVS